MDREAFKTIMEQANGRLMTALENVIMQDTGISRQRAIAKPKHIIVHLR